ncbi:MAG: hypothetical protein H6600_00095 [Flavobacteriales bacterium]|nr:hypothetical protein [Flavobacteriales bacterium]
MKKKILLIVLAIVLIAGSIVAYMTMTGAEVTEEDKAAEAQSNEELSGEGGVLENPEEITKPESDMDDAAADSLENALGIDEEFDPNDI